MAGLVGINHANLGTAKICGAELDAHIMVLSSTAMSSPRQLFFVTSFNLGAKLGVYFFKSVHPGHNCENLSKKGQKAKKMGHFGAN
jgi:hypothetical protein